MTDILEPFGPLYPFSRPQKNVAQAIRALQRKELLACLTPTPTREYDRDISKRVRAEQQRALALYPQQQRRARTPKQWQALYDQAMAVKKNGGA